MREFYQQVYVDEKELRFFAMCPICTRRHYAHRLPLICRILGNPKTLEKGRGGKLIQQAYNKSLVTAVQDLATQFNFCRSCGKWMCDDCFHSVSTEDICKKCETANKTTERMEE